MTPFLDTRPDDPTVPPLRVVVHEGTGWVSKAIQWQTRGDWSHASFLLPSGMLLEARETRGVVQERSLLDCRERTRVFTVVDPAMGPVETRARLVGARSFAEAQLGKDYDYTMVARFVTRRPEKRATSGKWFCSELIFAALGHAGLVLFNETSAWEVPPGWLPRSKLLVPV